MTDAAPPAPQPRLIWPDLLRGVALIAMASYHFLWDLQFFGYAASDFAVTGWPKAYARLIASSFLILVGISLVLAHRNGIDRRKLARRMLMLVAAAAAVSLATWFFSPQSFVYFGILHAIALFSLLGLLFLRLPAFLTLLIAVLWFGLAAPLKNEAFNHAALWWTGLSTAPRLSSDFVPLFPWFSAVLLGIALIRLLPARLLEASSAQPGAVTRGLTFLGRHSLAFYLIHQPVLIGLVWLATLVMPPPPPDPVAGYMRACEAQCSANNDAPACRTFCRCTIDRMMEESLFSDFTAGKISAKGDTRIARIGSYCSEHSF